MPTPTERYRGAEQCCPAAQLGKVGQGASVVTGGDSEDSGGSGVRVLEGVHTELRQPLGRHCFFSLLRPHCGASHLSLLQQTENGSVCPGREC